MASLGVNTHSYTHHFKDNSSHVLFHSQSAVWWLWKCSFTKLLCEMINIILYSAFEVITPSVEIICEEGWVTQLLLEAAHVQAQRLHFSLALFSTKPSCTYCASWWGNMWNLRKEVIWLFDLVTYSSFVTVFFNQCLRAKFFIGLSNAVHF